MRARQNQEILDEYLRTCHDQTDVHRDWSKATPHSAIFTSNATIGLAPETIIGPYWVGGEFIRSNIVEGQEGIHLDLQFGKVSQPPLLSKRDVPVFLTDKSLQSTRQPVLPSPT
jgi:hypothetical protein